MFYGKPANGPDQVGIELREVTFDGRPEMLRAVAGFLFAMASEIECGNLRTSHVHLSSTNLEWFKAFPDRDIIVALPYSWSDAAATPDDGSGGADSSSGAGKWRLVQNCLTGKNELELRLRRNTGGGFWSSVSRSKKRSA